MNVAEKNNKYHDRLLARLADYGDAERSVQRYWCSTFLRALYAVLLCVSSSLSVALNLSDRLDAPARMFSYPERSALLDIDAQGGRVLAVGERGVIIYSSDGGSTWHQAKAPVSTMLTALHMRSESNAWAVGHSGVILHSADGGQNWVKQFDGHDANQLLLQHAKERLAAISAEYQSASEEEQEDLIYEVEDAEFALSNAEFDLELGPANPFLDVYFESDTKGYAVGAYGLFFVTLDGGQSWQSWADRIENFDRYHLNAIRAFSDGSLLLVGEAGVMFVSYDGGEFWETIYGPYQGSYFGIESTGVEGEMLVYGLKGSVFKSSDAGQSWERIVLPATTSITSSTQLSDGSLVLAGFSGVLLKSEDHGNTFFKLKEKGLEGFNGVVSTGGDRNSTSTQSDENSLILVSDQGVQYFGF